MHDGSVQFSLTIGWPLLGPLAMDSTLKKTQGISERNQTMIRLDMVDNDRQCSE